MGAGAGMRLHRVCRDRTALYAPAMIIVSGASGLIGRALCDALRAQGQTVAPMVRRTPVDGEIAWSPSEQKLDVADLEGCRAVVHLAGESVFGLWTDKKKKRIRDSRVEGTRLIAERLASMPKPPEVMVCSSAVGYYPDSQQSLDESAAPGDSFLAEVCQAWEAAAEPARQAGIRTAHVRTGLVLSEEGGALGAMLPAFRMGVGGKLGSGEQWMSWITRRDLVRMLLWAIDNQDVEGALNAVSPNPVQNNDFTKTLGKVLSRPTFMSVPAFALKLGLGEFSTELLVSHRIEPAKAAEHGFGFEDPELEPALARIL